MFGRGFYVFLLAVVATVGLWAAACAIIHSLGDAPEHGPSSIVWVVLSLGIWMKIFQRVDRRRGR